MATNLKRLKIKEISLVDAPASPGADVILMKRDVSAEPRDGHGRWIVGAAGIAAAGAALYLGRHQISRYARHAATAAALHRIISNHGRRTFMHGATEQAARAGLFVSRNGAAALAASRGPAAATGKFLADKAGKAASAAAVAGGAAFANTKLKSVSQTRTGTRLSVESKIGGTKITRHFDVNPSTLFGSKGPSPDQNVEGTPHPINGEPIVTQRNRASNGAPIPLNTPAVSWRNAGGWSYKTGTGSFIPAGSSEQQKWIEENQGRAAAALPVSSSPSSDGSPYRTTAGDVIPGGSRDAQLKMEARYELERARENIGKRAMLFAGIQRPSLFEGKTRKGLFS